MSNQNIHVKPMCGSRSCAPNYSTLDKLKYSSAKATSLLAWGQRKNTISFMQFINDVVDNTRKYNVPLPTEVVYSGSSPGTSYLPVAIFAPYFNFHLIDPSDCGPVFFDYCMHTNSVWYRDRMTADFAQSFRSSLGNTPCVYYTDIRSGSDNNPNYEKEIICNDFKLHVKVCQCLKPICNGFKMRLPYPDHGAPPTWKINTTKLHIQSWAPVASTETRLFCGKYFTNTSYDCLEYEQKMHFFNVKERAASYPMVNSVSNCSCWDCYNEECVVREFATTFRPENVSLDEMVTQIYDAIDFVNGDERRLRVRQGGKLSVTKMELLASKFNQRVPSLVYRNHHQV